MAERRGRLRGIGGRLRRRRPAAAEADSGDEAKAPEPESDPFDDLGSAEDPATPLGDRPELGDLRESRSESIRRRLSGARRPLRGRLPRRKSSSGGPDDAPKHARPGLPARIWTQLKRVGGAIGAAAAATAHAARAGGLRVSDAWFQLSILARRRIAAAVGLLAFVLFVAFVLVPAAPCWAPGGDRCPPGDDAARLAPAEADGYVHLNLDPDTDQAEAAGGVVANLPQLTAQASGLLSSATDRVVDYQRDIAPWSAGELGVVLDAGIATIERTVLIEVADGEGAATFAQSFLGDGVAETDLDGITMTTDEDGISAAIASGFLILGPEASVIATVELARGRGDNLTSNADYRSAESALPEERLADAWLAPAFSEILVGEDSETFGQFNTFVNTAAGKGVAIALGFEEGALEVAIRSVQDPEAPKTDNDFFAALPVFEPTLADSIGADAFAYLGIGNPAESARTLVGQAADTAPELFAGLKRFNRNLENKDGVNLQEQLLPALDGEAALTVEPQQPAGDGDAAIPGTLAPTSVPYLALIATGVDIENALADIAALQAPIAQNVDPGSGQTPVFETTEIAGVDAQSLRLSPVVDLTYAGYDDELVIGTSPLAVQRARADADTLADSALYEKATEGLPESVSMLVYLNTRGLLGLGERLFLAEDPRYAQLATDLRALEAVTLAVNSGKNLLSTDLRVTVGEPPELETEAAPIAPSGG